METGRKRKNVCVVCRNTCSSVSYFKFPIDEKRKELWLRKCNLTKEQIYPSARLCATHFQEDAFTKISTNVKRRRLKLAAQPSVFNEYLVQGNAPMTKNLREKDKWCYLCGRMNEGRHHSYHRLPSDINLRNEWLKIVGYPPDLSKDVRLCDRHFSSTDLFTNPFSKRVYLKRGAVPITGINEAPEVHIPAQSENRTPHSQTLQISENHFPHSGNSSPEGRKVRYVGDLNDLDVATPKKAKRSLDFAKKVIANQRKKINNLQRQVRTANKKISALNDLLIQLHEMNSLGEDALHNIIVSSQSTLST